MVGVGQQCAKCGPVDLCIAARDLISETLDKHVTISAFPKLCSAEHWCSARRE